MQGTIRCSSDLKEQEDLIHHGWRVFHKGKFDAPLGANNAELPCCRANAWPRGAKAGRVSAQAKLRERGGCFFPPKAVHSTTFTCPQQAATFITQTHLVSLSRPHRPQTLSPTQRKMVSFNSVFFTLGALMGGIALTLAQVS